MLDQDQARILFDLASRALKFSSGGEIVGAPADFDIAEVADAMASLEAERDGSGQLALVTEYLRRLVPDLQAGAIDAASTPSAPRLASHAVLAAEVLAGLGGGTASPLPRRWLAKRESVELDLPGWVPLEVLDALARIGETLADGVESAWSPASMAYEVERQRGDGRRAAAIVEAVCDLLRVLDPEFDGHVTATSVELAAAAARRHEWSERLPDGWSWRSDDDRCGIAVGPGGERVWVHAKGSRKPPHIEFDSEMQHAPVEVVLACVARARRIQPEDFDKPSAARLTDAEEGAVAVLRASLEMGSDQWRAMNVLLDGLSRARR